MSIVSVTLYVVEPTTFEPRSVVNVALYVKGIVVMVLGGLAVEPLLVEPLLVEPLLVEPLLVEPLDC